MTYTPQSWNDNDPLTPVDATRLNYMEAGIAAAAGSSPLVSLDSAGCKADGGTTENAAIINTTLSTIYASGSSGGEAWLSGSHTQGYGITNPVLIPSGVILRGLNGRAGCALVAQPGFPTTTINGDQTTPASSATTFTLTVGATTGFPMATGGISVPDNVGVLCVNGITIHYTGTTGTTFTGCRTYDTSVLLPNTTAVSTFMVWVGGTAANSQGFGSGITNVEVFCGTSTAGISGIHSAHLQEQAEIRNMIIDNFQNFGIRIESSPLSTGNNQAVNYGVLRNICVQFAASPNANAVGIDLIDQFHAINQPFDSQRGIEDISVTVHSGGTPTVKAGLRFNGMTGGVNAFHCELVTTGILVGDLYPSHVTIQNGGFANSGFSNACIEIGNTASNAVEVRKVDKTNAASVPSRVLLKDDISTFSSTAGAIDLYRVNTDGSIQTTISPSAGRYLVTPGAVSTVNIPHLQPIAPVSATITPANANARGAPAFYITTTSTNIVLNFASALSAATSYVWNWQVGLLAPNPGIDLVQDAVATGARDNSSSSALTVTFAKTTTIGNTVILSAAAAGNTTLSSVTDSRGNTWQVDKVPSPSLQGVSANIASCNITIAHQIADTLTLTFSGAGTYAVGIVSEWSGLKSSSYVDVTQINQGASGTVLTGATTLRSQRFELIYTNAAYNNATPITQGAGFTLLTSQVSGAGNRTVTPEYMITKTTGTDQGIFTGSPGSYEAALVTYKAVNV